MRSQLSEQWKRWGPKKPLSMGPRSSQKTQMAQEQPEVNYSEFAKGRHTASNGGKYKQ